ncbi:AAA family ATPase [Candidatus Laterigemmans baculatus]|uniref:AAA family ATPase n=1 Tax=Candidatus Laterigemmans baculatus TaxID=2770505 RepID=UPI0013DCDB1D|nr:MoxR family ATPase [Candidatus Laterigemmans baculatus]
MNVPHPSHPDREPAEPLEPAGPLDSAGRSRPQPPTASAAAAAGEGLAGEGLAGGDVDKLARLAEVYRELSDQLAKRIVGQREVIDQVLTALVAGGHCLLVGVPGLAKTLLVQSLAETLRLDFHRIQFTPDLMPSDITGTEVLQEDRRTGGREFRFIPGPVFANIVLADEINRTPPKTQAALLEAMQEGQVTAAGQKHRLPRPFFVLATQNPIEQEGTYPLPEAQLDRFMFDIRVDYPDEEEELRVVMETTRSVASELSHVTDGAELLDLAAVVRRVPLAEPVARFAVALVRSTRPEIAGTPEEIGRYVAWGAGPRAGQFLALGGKARAALDGRYVVERRDIEAVALPVLRHRIRTNFAAGAEGVTVDEIVARVIAHVRQLERTWDDGRGLEKVFRTPHS